MRWNKNIPSFEVASSLEKVVDKHRHRQISPFPHDSYALLSQIIELMPEIVISADLADVEPGVGHATLLSMRKGSQWCRRRCPPLTLSRVNVVSFTPPWLS